MGWFPPHTHTHSALNFLLGEQPPAPPALQTGPVQEQARADLPQAL